MKTSHILQLLLTSVFGLPVLTPASADPGPLDQIKTIVVIYAENRSFDNLYGMFPGAEGIQNLKPEQFTQMDRDDKPLSELPPS